MDKEEEQKTLKYFYNLRASIDESYLLFDEELTVKCGNEMMRQITLILNILKQKNKIIYELAKANVELKGYEIKEEYINNTINFYTKYVENLERNLHWRKESN